MKKMKKITLLLLIIGAVTTLSFGQYKQAPLPYAYGSLEPYIDSSTMYIHYNYHHASYTAKLNEALQKFPELYKKDISELLSNINELPASIQSSVRNNGGGYHNHNLFWSMMAPAGSTTISKKLEKALADNFGSVEAFKKEFENAASTRFGSGWAWLVKLPNGKLAICSTPNQDGPYMNDADVKGEPVLALDVWEHAYYLKYQNKRGSYISSFWNVVNWKEVEKLALGCL